MEILLVVLVVAVLVIGTTALVAVRRRRTELLEPPPRETARPTSKVDVETVTLEVDELEVEVEEADLGSPEPAVVEAVGPAPRLRDRLGKARSALAGYVGSLAGRTKIDEEAWEQLEEALIRADVGVGATTALLSRLREQVKSQGLTDGDQLLAALRAMLRADLSGADRSLSMSDRSPTVWLFVGVNGVVVVDGGTFTAERPGRVIRR